MNTIVGIGCDLVYVNRLRDLHTRDDVAKKILSPAEFELYEKAVDKCQHLASRFAAKEAVIKACPDDVRPIDFEIIKENKKPIVRWVREPESKCGVLITITHEGEYASAFACAILTDTQ